MIKKIIFFLFLTFGFKSYSQNVYNEIFEGCNTQKFALESERKIAKIDTDELKKIISEITGEETRKKIRGILKIQIIVYKNGTSCFLSYENETNVISSHLNLQKFKELVDSELIWTNGVKNVTALIEVKYKKKKTELTRIGMNGTVGWHKLKD